MSRIVELKWDCRDCDQKGILGRNKKCPSCGSPREKGEMKMDGLGSDDYDSRTGRNKAATVTDPELLKLATSGADWFCSHCGSGNKGNGDKCGSCGGPRYATAEEDHPDFKGDHKHVQGFDEKLEEEMNRDTRPEEERTDPKPRARKPSVEEAWAKIQEEAKNDDYRPEAAVAGLTLGTGALIGGGVLLVVAFIAFVVWAMQTHHVVGQVTAMTWTRTVHVERWTDTTDRLWRHKTSERSEVPPVNGSGERAGLDLIEGSCRDEHYEDERYVCGHHKECEDIYRTERESYLCSKSERYVCGETCRDNGNGFATCSDKYCTRNVPDTCYRNVKVFDHKKCEDVKDYCTRPIYKAKCDYRTQEWQSAGNYPTSGSGKDFVWGTEPTGDEVRRFYSATYTVSATYTDGGKTEHYDVIEDSVSRSSRSAAEGAARPYLSWSLKDPVAFEINNLGGVHQATHTSALEK